MAPAHVLACLALALTGCSKEARTLTPSQPQTPPTGSEDPRIPLYQSNVYQISQGGRYFSWYGCGACHTDNSPGSLNLADNAWAHGGSFDQVYASIADAHGRLRYRDRIPTEQLWQLTAYIRDLNQHQPEKRRRQNVDQSAEPQGPIWSGPQR